MIAAVEILEDSPLFNAGIGAVYTHDETYELDASLMVGDTLTLVPFWGISGKEPASFSEVSDGVFST